MKPSQSTLPRRCWWPVARASDLGSRAPLGIDLLDAPVVLFRDHGGQPHALVDRCPHRNVPLSNGRVTNDGTLECGYHGWRFDGAGTCLGVPGLLPAAVRANGGNGESAAPIGGRVSARDVDRYPTTEQDGFVWVWADPAHPPTESDQPFRLSELPGRPSTIGEVMFRYDLDATLHAALENHLDVPHTAFLHRGIFRGGEPNELTAVRRDLVDERTGEVHGIEVQYLGEPVGLGSFRPGARRSRPDDPPLTFDHWDRFYLPGIAQVEYRVADQLHIVNTILHLPLSATRTRAWFVVRFRTPVPAAVATPIVFARGRSIARQDVAMLAAQTANVVRFGGERYASTDLDIIGAGIWRLLRSAVRDETGTDDEDEPHAASRADVTERRVAFRA